MYLKHLE